jgi:ribosomal protein S18 acetylase RimI-like enzyme
MQEESHNGQKVLLEMGRGMTWRAMMRYNNGSNIEEESGSMIIVIQDAVPNDDDRIRYIQHQTWLATYPNEELGITKEAINARFVNVSAEIVRRRAANKQRINTDPSVHIWVAKDEYNSIIGFCIAVKEALNGYIQAIYVLPTYQGQGAGKRLMQTALDWLGDKKPVKLSVATYNEKAMTFYRSLGFVVNDNSFELSITQLPSGVNIPQIEMIRPSRT